MESVRVMLLQYGHIIQIVDDPRDVAQQEIVNIVVETKGPITFSEAVKVACHMNIQVKHYLDNRNLMAGDNKRYHDLREIFMDNMDSNRITITQLKPLTLVWSSRGDTATTNDLNDLTDLACDMQAKMMKNNTESLATTKRVWSERLVSTIIINQMTQMTVPILQNLNSNATTAMASSKPIM
jgi:hypothetical protein